MMRLKSCFCCSLVLAFATSSATLQAQTPPSGGYAITTIGLTGGNYQYTSGNGLFLYSDAIGTNQADQATGYSNRYASSGTSLGQDSWFFNGSSTVQIGLTGANYSYTIAGSGVYQNSAPVQINSAGQVLGSSNRYNSTGASLGYDAWVYNGTSTVQVGLTGTNYSYTYTGTGGGTYQESDATAINNAGQATGDSVRYSASGGALGYDSWFYNGSTTVQIGLIGTNYSYSTSGGAYEESGPSAINSSGQVLGFSYRFNSSGTYIGYDAWLYSAGANTRLGLSGASYQTTIGSNTYQYSFAGLLNDAGMAAGYSARVDSSGGTSLGEDSWLYNGSSTIQIGLTGANYQVAASGGTFQYSSPSQLNSAGQVTGTSLRYSSSGGSLGQDSWLYNGSATVQVGLTSSAYQYASSGGTFQSSTPVQLNSAGQVIGTSNRYNSSGSALGQDSWLYNGSATVQIGLTGGSYQYTFTGTGGGSYQSSTPIQVNSTGQVIGTSAIYNTSGGSLGQAGWFFNGTSTVALSFSFRSSDNYTTTTPAILTNQGVVLGSYELYNGTTDMGAHAFWWSQTAGFYDLGTLVTGGLTANGWLSLANVYGSTIPGTQGGNIFGTGELITMSGGQLVFELTPTPEPRWTLALSALAACLLALARRSRGRFALR